MRLRLLLAIGSLAGCWPSFEPYAYIADCDDCILECLKTERCVTEEGVCGECTPPQIDPPSNEVNPGTVDPPNFLPCPDGWLTDVSTFPFPTCDANVPESCGPGSFPLPGRCQPFLPCEPGEFRTVPPGTLFVRASNGGTGGIGTAADPFLSLDEAIAITGGAVPLTLGRGDHHVSGTPWQVTDLQLIGACAQETKIISAAGITTDASTRLQNLSIEAAGTTLNGRDVTLRNVEIDGGLNIDGAEELNLVVVHLVGEPGLASGDGTQEQRFTVRSFAVDSGAARGNLNLLGEFDWRDFSVSGAQYFILAHGLNSSVFAEGAVESGLGLVAGWADFEDLEATACLFNGSGSISRVRCREGLTSGPEFGRPTFSDLVMRHASFRGEQPISGQRLHVQADLRCSGAGLSLEHLRVVGPIQGSGRVMRLTFADISGDVELTGGTFEFSRSRSSALTFDGARAELSDLSVTRAIAVTSTAAIVSNVNAGSLKIEAQSSVVDGLIASYLEIDGLESTLVDADLTSIGPNRVSVLGVSGHRLRLAGELDLSQTRFASLSSVRLRSRVGIRGPRELSMSDFEIEAEETAIKDIGAGANLVRGLIVGGELGIDAPRLRTLDVQFVGTSTPVIAATEDRR